MLVVDDGSTDAHGRARPKGRGALVGRPPLQPGTRRRPPTRISLRATSQLRLLRPPRRGWPAPRGGAGTAPGGGLERRVRPCARIAADQGSHDRGAASTASTTSPRSRGGSHGIALPRAAHVHHSPQVHGHDQRLQGGERARDPPVRRSLPARLRRARVAPARRRNTDFASRSSRSTMLPRVAGTVEDHAARVGLLHLQGPARGGPSAGCRHREQELVRRVLHSESEAESKAGR